MTEEQIGKNVEHVKAEIAQAAGDAGRDPAEILLVAATKMNDASAVRAAERRISGPGGGPGRRGYLRGEPCAGDAGEECPGRL